MAGSPGALSYQGLGWGVLEVSACAPQSPHQRTWEGAFPVAARISPWDDWQVLEPPRQELAVTQWRSPGQGVTV